MGRTLLVRRSRAIYGVVVVYGDSGDQFIRTRPPGSNLRNAEAYNRLIVHLPGDAQDGSGTLFGSWSDYLFVFDEEG